MRAERGHEVTEETIHILPRRSLLESSQGSTSISISLLQRNNLANVLRRLSRKTASTVAPPD